jgi:microcompartment protein CcmL/EutN
MFNTLGVLEFRSVAIGLAATNDMLKRSSIELVFSTVLCPGKYVVMISGDIEAVKEAVRAVANFDESQILGRAVISNLNSEIFGALTGTTNCKASGALGVVETLDVASAVEAADIAAKSANISLLEIRIARGMGGKCVVFYCGELDAVKTATEAAIRAAGKNGSLIASSVIASPHPDLQL